MKPEIGAALFMPLVQQIKECDLPLERWNEADPESERLSLDERTWIDETTFRGLIAMLLNAKDDRRLAAAAARLLDDEALGLNDLVLPFARSPYDVLDVLVEHVNQNARTIRLTLGPPAKRGATLSMTSTQKKPGAPVLCRWLESLLRAARRDKLTFDFTQTECMFGLTHPGRLDEDGRPEPEAKACVYQLQWKARRFANPFAAAARLRAARENLGKFRRLLGQQRGSLEQAQNQLRQQEALLQGIVSMSEASKSAKTYRELIHLTANRICASFGFDRSQIYLAREGQLEIVSVIDPNDMAWAQTVFAVCQAHPIPLDGRTEESKAFASGKPVIVASPWNNVFVPPPQQEAWKSRGYLIVPIRGADRVIGLMLADHYYKRRNIEPEDVDRLQALAHLSGMGIEKLRLIDKLEAKVTERTAELERANKKLMSLYEKARESDRLKSDFLANMSHELRTPLNSILGFSKLLLREFDGPLNERQQTDVNAILNSGTHLLGLINDILDLSKIESGRMELKFEDFPLNDVVNEVVTSSGVLIKDKPLALSVSLDDRLGLVRGDRTRVRQVLTNLVGNAIKFTKQGQITITTRAGAAEYYIAVTDTGVGIPADKVDSAFERFRQLDSSPSRMQGGSGLGLTISKKFVEMHGGRIWVTSAEGVGSTFHISVPMPKEMEKAAGAPRTEQ